MTLSTVVPYGLAANLSDIFILFLLELCSLLISFVGQEAFSLLMSVGKSYLFFLVESKPAAS